MHPQKAEVDKVAHILESGFVKRTYLLSLCFTDELKSAEMISVMRDSLDACVYQTLTHILI